jgi:hypothetical protein
MKIANAAIVDLANKVVLKAPNLNIVPDNDDYPWFIRHFQAQLQAMETRNELLLPNLHLDNEAIAIFSDYGGEHAGSSCSVYSFLICAGHVLRPFEKAMEVLRNEHGLNDPLVEIQFKELNYGPIRRSLPQYLYNLNNLVNGLLLTVVVEKEIPTIFGFEKKPTHQFITDTLIQSGLGNWNPHSAEKLLRVTHFISYLVALLSKPYQDVFWMTDHDAIAPSTERHQHALDLFSNLLRHYCKHPLGTISGAVPFDEKVPLYLDLLSSTDIAAGSIEHYLSRAKKGDAETVGKEGITHVLRWFCNQGVLLKKYAIRISKADGNFHSGTIRFHLKEPDINAVVAPVLIKPKRQKR